MKIKFKLRDRIKLWLDDNRALLSVILVFTLLAGIELISNCHNEKVYKTWGEKK